jgi:hypothetical protein
MARRGINLVLLTTVALHCGLALADHHTTTADPSYDHIVLAVRYFADLQQIASRHPKPMGSPDHGQTVAHPAHHGASSEASGVPIQIISIPNHDHSNGMSLFGVSMEYLFALGRVIHLGVPAGTTSPLVLAFVMPTEVSIPPPEPPPRLAVTLVVSC